MKNKKIFLRLIQSAGTVKPLLPYATKYRKASAIYYDITPESVRMKQVTGTCIFLKRKGINSKLAIRVGNHQGSFIQSFFVNGPHFIDFWIWQH